MGTCGFKENILQLIRTLLMLSLIIWANMLAPKLQYTEPFIGVFVIYTAFCAGISLYFDWEEKRIRDRKK
jgi:ABC-type amino acid transport system permease subunit